MCQASCRQDAKVVVVGQVERSPSRRDGISQKPYRDTSGYDLPVTVLANAFNVRISFIGHLVSKLPRLVAETRLGADGESGV